MTEEWKIPILYDNLQASEKEIARLKQENKQMKSVLNRIQRMILAAWELGKYLDGGLYEDLTNEFAKINNVERSFIWK
jgi:hypothetical protein